MVTTIVVLAIGLIMGTFAWGALRGAPWVPTRRRDVDRAVAFAQPHSGARVVDLGCGDGTVLAAFAARGCRVRGWELALFPWALAQWRLRASRSARITWGDFWRASLTDADIVYAFLMPKVLPRVAEKLQRELRSGALVLTYVWPMPGGTPDAVDTAVDAPPIYRYRIP